MLPPIIVMGAAGIGKQKRADRFNEHPECFRDICDGTARQGFIFCSMRSHTAMSWSVIRAAPGPEPAVGDADGGDVPAENRVPFACFFAGTDPVCTQEEPSEAGHAMVARGSRG